MRLQKKNSVMDVKRFIQVYDNCIEENICKELINFFENNPNKHERVENERVPNFTQFNITQNLNISQRINQLHNYLIEVVLYYKSKYYNLMPDFCFPESHSFEQFRIKKYNNDGNDMFDEHVDVTDYLSSRRFLSLFWYLNDVDEGGETVFSDLTIKPQTGKLVIFPPLWMFPHKGNPPISNTKYLLSTYLHYM